MKKSKHKKVIKIILIVVASLAFALYILFPVGVGIFATFRFPEKVNDPPKGFEEVTLQTSDNIELAAWYAPSENHAVIILVHGATDSREGIRSHAEMLCKNGYGVLAFDMRGHGESKGDGLNGYNWKGNRDVGAAIEFLKKKCPDDKIGALGLSLGGEVLLSSASEFPEIKAIASDGATQRTVDDYLLVPSNKSLIRSFTTRLMYFSARIFSGDKPPVTIFDSIKAAKDTSFYYIAAGNEADEKVFNTIFQEATKDRSEFWLAENTGHIKALFTYPSEYEKRITGFFNKHLLNSES